MSGHRHDYSTVEVAEAGLERARRKASHLRQLYVQASELLDQLDEVIETMVVGDESGGSPSHPADTNETRA